MSQAATELIRISGHAGVVPGKGLNREFQVCKLVDTTTCIGCKACEVACLEWNGYTFSETTFDNTYQTMPETAWNYWNLIKFNEHERADGTMMLLMRKDQCMHCADPGCLAACPADAAIVQYANGIVDFQEANCIGCGYCMTGCPFNIPKFDPPSRKVFKCTLCNDRVSVGLEPACIKACPTGCSATSHQLRIPGCRSLRSGRSRRNARDLRFARCQESRVVWRTPARSADPLVSATVEGPVEMDWESGDGRRHRRHGPALHAIWPQERRADSAEC
jgi:Fe-S-cluster-containing dehydrogenase component